MKRNLLYEMLVELVERDGIRNYIFELTLEQCDWLYSQGVSVEQVKNSIYPTHYKLTLEK